MKKILALFLLITSSFSLQAATLDQEQQNQVRQLIRQTLVDNPEIIVEAINGLRQKEMEKQQQGQKAVIEKNKTALFENSSDPYRGAKNPKLTIAYFSDFNCGYCKRQEPILENILKSFPNVRIVYKYLPILGESSREAALLMLAASKQYPEKLPALHQKLMAKTGKHDSDSIAAAFKAEGIDSKAMLEKSDLAALNKQLDSNIQLATQLGIQGTPALVFPDHVQGGLTDEEQLSEIIKSEG